MAKVSFPYQYFPDPTRGKPLFNGSIYIGTADTDPEVESNQIQAYAVTESGDVAIPQPLKTGSGGVVMYSGSAVGVRVDVDSYSIKMLDSNGSQVYYAANFSPSSTLAETQAAIDTDVTNRLVEKYASVAALKLTELPSGQRVSTRSYYAQDIAQGGAEYDILTLQEVRDAKGDPAWVPDGYGDHSLVNGNVAVISGGYSVLQFGAVGDNQADDTPAFDSCLSNSGSIYLPQGNYSVSKTFAEFDVVGPGNYWLNGSELLGGYLRLGVNNGNNSNSKYGGLVVGGQDDQGNGLLYRGGGNHAWNRVEPTYTGAECQFQLYTGAFVRRADSVVGTGFIDATYGDFADAKIAVGDIIAFAGTDYEIKTRVSDARLELQQVGGGAVSFASAANFLFVHCYQYAEGVCDTDGTSVTRTSGDFFIGGAVSDDHYITINGVKYDIASRASEDSLTLSVSAGSQSSVNYVLKNLPSSRLITISRLQSLKGGSEENLMVGIDAYGNARIETQFAGQGEYRPIKLRTGPATDNGASLDALTIEADGNIKLNSTLLNSDAKLEVNQRVIASSIGGGTSELELLRLASSFGGADIRWLEVVARNNFRVPYLQGRQQGGGALELRLSSEGGGVVIGSHDAKPANTGLWVAQDDIVLGAATRWVTGSGSPEGVVTAAVGSMYSRTDGGAGTTLYVKESGAGTNTGWVAK